MRELRQHERVCVALIVSRTDILSLAPTEEQIIGLRALMPEFYGNKYNSARVTLFLRDNMARAVEQLDPDYSCNIEGQVLRLHWEENQLFPLLDVAMGRIGRA